MGIRIPSNQIITSKYTSGKEYMFESTYREYQGYYYETNNKTFAGKEFDIDAPTLIPINSTNVNTLLTRAATYVYGKVSNVNIGKISNIKSHIFQYEDNIRYFTYQINKKLIKEVNKDSFGSISQNPIYKTISLSYIGGFDDGEVERAELIIPGIKIFTDTLYVPPQISDGEDGLG